MHGMPRLAHYGRPGGEVVYVRVAEERVSVTADATRHAGGRRGAHLWHLWCKR